MCLAVLAGDDAEMGRSFANPLPRWQSFEKSWVFSDVIRERMGEAPMGRRITAPRMVPLLFGQAAAAGYPSSKCK
jgi:hypothetical protein